MSHHDSESRLDPVVASYLKVVDRTLLRENLRLSPEERIREMQSLLRVLAELRESSRRLKRRVLPKLIERERAARRTGGNPVLAELQALLEERTRTAPD